MNVPDEEVIEENSICEYEILVPVFTDVEKLVKIVTLTIEVSVDTIERSCISMLLFGGMDG